LLSQYPYSLSALAGVLATQWDSPSFKPYRDAFPAAHCISPEAYSAHVHDLVSRDVKASYLKSLQGYLWVKGYESGEIRCPLFPDVAPVFDTWHKAGIPIIIYSSGSVAAQKLLFQYTNSELGDMRGMISGYFDTVNAGVKRDKSSYEKIAKSRKEDIRKWLFLSDQVQEVEAAKEAGMQSLIVVREGNAPLGDGDKRHNLIQSFDEINIQGVDGSCCFAHPGYRWLS
jgi:enolase-phosphatase E1